MGTLTTRSAVEILIPAAVQQPTLFITTAMPKSGSNWLEAMIFNLPGVGGFGGGAGSCGYLTLSALTRVPEALPFLAAAGMPLGDALARLLDPALRPGAPLGESCRGEANRIFAKVRLRIPPQTGLLRPDEPRVPTLSRLLEPLFAAPAQPPISSPWAAVGCPAKHEPASKLADRLPGWKIVQLIRDPRDVLVSRFYHDLAHVDPGMAALFVTGVGERVRMRTDWAEAYFGKRRDELLAYYERFEDPRLDSTVRLVVRYEDLLIDPAGRLAQVARFIGLDPDASGMNLASVCDRFSFDRLASGDGAQTDAAGTERRNSFLRRGRAGDWREYFDRRLTGTLGSSFDELLVRLGYEPDDRWVQRVPTRAERAWDFARLRPRQSLARSFRVIWEADATLQERFPDPTDVAREGESFVDAIVASGDRAVLSHRALLGAMARLWSADVRETAAF